jgi:hypothetical protein
MRREWKPEFQSVSSSSAAVVSAAKWTIARLSRARHRAVPGLRYGNVGRLLEGFKNVPSVGMLDSRDYAWIAAKGD